MNISLKINSALLFALLAAVPPLAIGTGSLEAQLLTMIVALMMFLLPSVAEADIRSTVQIFRPLCVTTLLPIAWMLFQMTPLPRGSFGHPIWPSAADALSEPFAAHISIDPGITCRSLFQYVSLASLVFITAALTRNRERAETFLFGLCAVTTFVAVWSVFAHHWQVFQPLQTSVEFLDALSAISAFGAILNAAFVVRCVERRQTHGSSDVARRSWIGLILTAIVATLACVAAVMLGTGYSAATSMFLGLAVLALVVLIRQLGLRPWTTATACLAASVAAAGIIAVGFVAHPSVRPIFRFVAIEPDDAPNAASRFVADGSWFGAGAGNFSGLAAIYRDANGFPAPLPLNSIECLLIEWGYGGLIIATVISCEIFILLFWGALIRGRDSFYAAASASCLLAGCCRAFCDSTLSDLAMLLLMALILGVGLAQTIGRQSK